MNGVISIGTDLVSIQRIDHLLLTYGDRFLERVYTPAEVRESCGSPSYLAGRFAVKEAVLKAIGTGLSEGIRWQDVETTRTSPGAPLVRLQGRAKDRMQSLGGDRVLVSISHEREMAMAFVLITGCPR